MKIEIPFSPPDIGEAEIQAVSEVLRSGWITTGPKTKMFEEEIARFCGTKRAVCFNAATSALECALRLLGIGPGDEVIAPAYTYTATVSPICHVGAKPVLVDVAPDSYEMDYDAVSRAITRRTKAIIPVDLGGMMCDYDTLFSIVEDKRKLFRPKTALQKAIGHVAIVADAAHAFGATSHGMPCGSVADFTSFSFHAVKNFTTAEGGALTWHEIEGIDDEEIYHSCQLLSLHGQDKDALAKNKPGSWEYDIVAPDYKWNMTDIMAAIGLAQMERYPGMLARRKEILRRYAEGLCGGLDASALINGSVRAAFPIQLCEHYSPDGSSSGHLGLVRLNGYNVTRRNRFIESMADKGVSTNVHYKPLPMMTAYRNMGFRIEKYPNAYAQYANEITLPVYTLLTDDQIDYVIDAFNRTLAEGL